MSQNGHGTQVNPEEVINSLLRQLSQLQLELAMRDAVISQLRATEEVPQSEVVDADLSRT